MADLTVSANVDSLLSAADYAAMRTLLSLDLLVLESAAVLAQRNSTNAQTHKIYNTYTDASNGEWLSLDWATTNVATIKTTAAGTGTVRALRLESRNFRLLHSTGGADNLFLGHQSGNYSVTGTRNTGIGYGALVAMSSGINNSSLGWSSLDAETTGSYNVAFGEQALTTQNGATYNTAVGRSAGALLSTGSYNTILGGLALDAETTGGDNVAIGYAALGGSNGGLQNTALGANAGKLITTGDNNVLLGHSAGDNLTTGSSNIIIGSLVDAQSATADGQISIGNLIFGTAVGTGTTASTGNVGIGQTTPAAKLDVKGDIAVKNSTSAVEQTIYNTYTDASNYERLEIGFKDTLNVATIKTAKAGTGTVRDLKLQSGSADLTVKGTSVSCTSTGEGIFYVTRSTNAIDSWGIYFSNTYSSKAKILANSVGVSSNAGQLDFQTRQAGGSYASGILITETQNVGIGIPSPATKLSVDGAIKSKTYTVATLPAAGTAGAGATAFVSDGSVVHAGNSGSIVAGSGANFVPVYSDGTNWRIT